MEFYTYIVTLKLIFRGDLDRALLRYRGLREGAPLFNKDNRRFNNKDRGGGHPVIDSSQGRWGDSPRKAAVN